MQSPICVTLRSIAKLDCLRRSDIVILPREIEENFLPFNCVPDLVDFNFSNGHVKTLPSFFQPWTGASCLANAFGDTSSCVSGPSGRFNDCTVEDQGSPSLASSA